MNMENTSATHNGASSSRSVNFHNRRLCLSNVCMDVSKEQILEHLCLAEFPGVNVYMPKNCKNVDRNTRLVFLDFQQPWEASIARKLVNLLKFNKVVASYATEEPIPDQISLPPLIERRTLTSDGNHVNNGTCANCGDSIASKVCAVCFTMYSCTFYCNKDHQAKDWSKHKFDCKPLPDLVLPADAAQKIMDRRENMTKKKFLIPLVPAFTEGDFVVITHVASSRVIFVRSLKEEQNLKKLEAEVRSNAEKAAMHSEAPEIDDTVLAPLNGVFVRAQVVDVDTPEAEVEGSEIRCFFVDYGISLKLPSNNLKKLNYKVRTMPRHAFKVILEDVQISSSKEVSQYLNDLMEKEEELEVVKVQLRGSNDRYVVLKLKGRDEIVNLRINRMITHQEQQFCNDTRILFDESQCRRIEVGCAEHVRLMDVSLLKMGLVSCMSTADFVHYWKLNKEINDYGNIRALNEVYEPRLNELCLVKNGDRWERGAIIEFSSYEVLTLFVDRFVKEAVPRCNVRQLPVQFASDFFTSLCHIPELNETNLAVAKTNLKARSNVIVDLVEFDEVKKRSMLAFDFLSS